MLYLTPASYWFVALATPQLHGWRQYIFPECQWTSTDPHDITIEKTVLFRVTAVITKSPTGRVCNFVCTWTVHLHGMMLKYKENFTFYYF